MEEKRKYFLGLFAGAIITLVSFQIISLPVSSHGDPKVIELDYTVVAGCVIEDCVDVFNPGQTGIFAIDYSISPNGDGITVKIPESISIKKCKTKPLCFTIETDSLLIPGIYHVTITLYRNKPTCNLKVQAWYSDILNYKHSYLRVKISNDHQLNGMYRGWCVDLDACVQRCPYTATAYSTLEETGFEEGLLEHPENLDLVNWIINQHYIGTSSGKYGRYTYGDIQRAIWSLIENHQSSRHIGSYSQCRVNKILSEASSHNGFAPRNGDVIAMILKPCSAQTQICIIEVPFNIYSLYSST